MALPQDRKTFTVPFHTVSAQEQHRHGDAKENGHCNDKDNGHRTYRVPFHSINGLDGFIGQDLLREFSAVRIDYKNHVVEWDN